MTILPRMRFVPFFILTAVATALCLASAPAEPASPPAASSTTRSAEAASQPSRMARRPSLTEEQYTQLADELRDAYSKPPDQWPAPEIDEAARPTLKDIGLLPKVEFPADN